MRNVPSVPKVTIKTELCTKECSAQFCDQFFSSIVARAEPGGEQQMLAIARALVQNPELILMDEPSEGLSPRLANEVGDIVARLNSEGCSILLVEQNLAFAQRLAHHVCVMNKGSIVCEGSPGDIDRDPAFRRYLSVNASADRSPAAISLN